MATPQPRGGLGPGPCWSWRIPGPSLKGGRNCGAPEFEPSSLGRFTVFSLLPAFPVLLSPEVPLLFIHFLTLASVIRSPFSPLCPKTSHTRNIDRLCSPVSPSPPPPPASRFRVMALRGVHIAFTCSFDLSPPVRQSKSFTPTLRTTARRGTPLDPKWCLGICSLFFPYRFLVWIFANIHHYILQRYF